MISIFPHAAGPGAFHGEGGFFAAIDAATIGNAMLVPLAWILFGIVWLAGHAINMLILISPFTSVDTALKGLRLSLLSLVAGSAAMNPYFGAGIALVVILAAWLLAGWSFRLTIFGSVYIWDFVTIRRKRSSRARKPIGCSPPAGLRARPFAPTAGSCIAPRGKSDSNTVPGWCWPSKASSCRPAPMSWAKAFSIRKSLAPMATKARPCSSFPALPRS